MLTIFIFIGIATGFSRLAFDKDRNRWVWGTIGVASYFILQILAGILMALLKPEWLENKGILTTVSMVAGFSGVGIAYYILHQLPSLDENMVVDSQLLDSNMD